MCVLFMCTKSDSYVYSDQSQDLQDYCLFVHGLNTTLSFWVNSNILYSTIETEVVGSRLIHV